jgi:hypothetical protein
MGTHVHERTVWLNEATPEGVPAHRHPEDRVPGLPVIWISAGCDGGE